MLSVKKWPWLSVGAAMLVALAAVSSTAGVTGVSDDEGARVQGGQTSDACTDYKSKTVFCGDACSGMSCGNSQLLSTGTGTSAKAVEQKKQIECFTCSQSCGKFDYTNYLPCNYSNQ